MRHLLELGPGRHLRHLPGRHHPAGRVQLHDPPRLGDWDQDGTVAGREGAGAAAGGMQVCIF